MQAAQGRRRVHCTMRRPYIGSRARLPAYALQQCVPAGCLCGAQGWREGRSVRAKRPPTTHVPYCSVLMPPPSRVFLAAAVVVRSSHDGQHRHPWFLAWPGLAQHASDSQQAPGRCNEPKQVAGSRWQTPCRQDDARIRQAQPLEASPWFPDVSQWLVSRLRCVARFSSTDR